MTHQPLVPAIGPHLRFPFHLTAETLVVVVSHDSAMVDRALDALWNASYVGYYGETLFVQPPVITRRPVSLGVDDPAHDRDVVIPAIAGGKAVFMDNPAWCNLVTEAAATHQPVDSAQALHALGPAWMAARTAVLVVLGPTIGTERQDIDTRRWLLRAKAARAGLEHAVEVLVPDERASEFIGMLNALRGLGVYGQLARKGSAPRIGRP